MIIGLNQQHRSYIWLEPFLCKVCFCS